jgi:uncharacterized protein YndB with AHSA1/START domain
VQRLPASGKLRASSRRRDVKWFIRISLALLLLLLVGTLGLLLAGRREGAGLNQATVEIARPAAQVWRHMEDPALSRKWMSGIIEMTPLTEGGLRVGARERLVIAVDADERMVMESEFTRIEKPHRLELTIQSGADADVTFIEHVIYTLDEQDGRTKVAFTGRTEYSGLAALFEPIITPTAQAKLEGDLQALKASVEAEPVPEPLPAP